MYVSGILEDSVVDGLGLRTTVFVSGCGHNCPGCHNKETHDFKYGTEFTLEKQLELIEKIKRNPILKGITLSGGDCMFSPEDTLEFLKLYKEHFSHHDVWIYTGFTMEEVLKDVNKSKLLTMCDVLVDGRFMESKKNLSLKFRGSSNQRILDVESSLKQDKPVIFLD